ncbi:lipid asymmetry maintenance protein MlaB [Hafnia alvei]|uniref:Phospholipid transport system transporter-binding protein n=1 Tax=Hafnia alvei TaxID=569 RepID=A0A1C6Z037_HAFAL|nr:lipid asymmetry maintenance protein MlaB [Hafnia alvei]NLS53262.1 lipid asymmetry maintenance protein MlaB [Hafnia alvei]SCM52486.1 phospholipid transport system transporter-binding protein [Hafnia alvei]
MTPNVLQWRSEEDTLKLIGILDRDSLMSFWDDRHTLLEGKKRLDLSELVRVDSAGLAMLVHVQNTPATSASQIVITGVSERLRTLIALYNLNEVLIIDGAELAS